MQTAEHPTELQVQPLREELHLIRIPGTTAKRPQLQPGLLPGATLSQLQMETAVHKPVLRMFLTLARQQLQLLLPQM